MPICALHPSGPSLGLAQNVARHAICSGRLTEHQHRTPHVQCSAKVSSSDTDAGQSRSLQSLLSRLATDATGTLTNIVPLPINRSGREVRPSPEPAQRPLQDSAAPPAGSSSTQELENQLEQELHAQGQKTGLLDLLRHWRSTAQRDAESPADQELHPALHLLQQRMQSGSRPGLRDDGFKLGLAVEGGGMRGCVTAGGLRALHALGCRDAFDAVYGSSAGAMNLTYYLSEQAEGVDIYHEDIANEDFCNMRRLLNRNEGPALNLDMLINDVMGHVKPLNWEAVLNSPIPLKVVASCLDTLQPVILDDFASKEDLQQCLRASAQVPAVAGDPIEHRGRRLVDAAVFEPVPFRAAISDGCTHVITLCSRPPMNNGWLSQMKEDMLSEVVKRAVLSPGYMKAAWARELENLRAFGLTTDQMMMASLSPTSSQLSFLSGSHNYPVIPGPDSRFSPVSIDPKVIRAGIAAGSAAVNTLLGQQLAQFSARKEDSPFFDAGLIANGMEGIAYGREGAFAQARQSSSFLGL